jgi:hypothetical protein
MSAQGSSVCQPKIQVEYNTTAKNGVKPKKEYQLIIVYMLKETLRLSLPSPKLNGANHSRTNVCPRIVSLPTQNPSEVQHYSQKWSKTQKGISTYNRLHVERNS